MTDVAPSHNPLPPTNAASTKANKAVDSAVKLEQLLKQCETKAVGEAEAQKVVDRLDKLLSEKLDPSKKKRYLVSLMKICKVYPLLPTSYLILDTELEKLGEQPFDEQSNVWAGCYNKAGQESDQEPECVSIKILSQYVTGQEKVKKRLCREAVIWKRMSHPNVLPFIGVSFSKELAIIYPWMENGDVLGYLRENREANPVKLLEESATGLQYLHDMGLVHGDLQPGHILVTDDGRACLANVGHASLNREKGDSKFGTVSVSVDAGNNRYLPPEYFTDEFASKHATRKGDIYSMGMTIYEVLTDKRPFPNHSSISVVMPITSGMRPGKPDFEISRGYTEELWELTTTCWQQVPTERPTISELIERLGNVARQWNSSLAA